ncbi:MAG: 50S ribosomal protein L22, partial [Actinomycetota bacterium]|nr:50S ribosomal protein L22 [Actinomycetota bacterium]
MPGPRLNDGATTLGERVGTKASAKYVRTSASKARVVLDLIRGLDVRRASEVLRFSERAVSTDIAKVLQSAVANAMHNDAQDAEELYVAACYADEGPTMRRFRPRARGRATRIRKRSCHITIMVARLSDDRLEVLTNRESSRGAAGRTGTAQSRRERVERSRRRAQGLREGAPAAETEGEETVEALAPADDTHGSQSFGPQDVEDSTSAGEGSASDEPESSEPQASETGITAPEDGSVPDGFEIKG